MGRRIPLSSDSPTASSFGELQPHAARIKALGIPLICQAQSMKYVREAVDAGADIIAAEGCEAGGHSGHRGTLTLVPEAANYLAKHSPDTILVAAGGMATDMASPRLSCWARKVFYSAHASLPVQSLKLRKAFAAIIEADGDSTIKSHSVDLARKRYWPNPEFVVRVLKNGFVARWHGRERELEKSIEVEHERFWSAFKAGDADNSGVLLGEVSGIIHDAPSAAQTVETIVTQACKLLTEGSRYVMR